MVGAIKGIDSKQGNKVASFALRLLLGATLASIISKYYWLSFINNKILSKKSSLKFNSEDFYYRKFFIFLF